jgi:HlyD family secretion protein
MPATSTLDRRCRTGPAPEVLIGGGFMVSTERGAAPASGSCSTLRLALAAATTMMALALPAYAGAETAAEGVAALGRIEPLGGVIHVGAPSMPDAVSGGILAKLYVGRGQDVTAGQLLAEIDTAPILKARLAEAEAGLETARRSARAAVSIAEEACVVAAVSARTSGRKNELLARGLTSKEEAELAKGDAEAGAASCAARRAEASVAESQVASAATVLTLRRAELERAYVRAPFAGRVLDLKAKPGELVAADGILDLGRVGEMYAIAEVYETDIRRVRVNQRARVKSDALAQPIVGTVTLIRPHVHKMDEIGTDPAARKDARIIEVEIRLDDPAAVANLTNLQVEVEIGR